MSAVAAIKKAGSLDQDKLVAAMSGLHVRHAVRPGHLPRARPPVDHGRLRRPHGLKDGKGIMTDWRFVDGKDALPSDDEVKKMRPAN